MRFAKSLRNINYKLLVSLLFLGLCPTVYNTLRIFWLGQLPGEYSFSIAGQLSWVNLFYEVLNESIILPLFFFVGLIGSNKKELSNRLKTGLLVSFITYFIVSSSVFIFAEPLLKLMATSPNIINESVNYIRLETIAAIFTILFQFSLVFLVAIDNKKLIYVLTFVQLILCSLLDLFFVSNNNFSLNLGVNGIAITNIIVYFSLFLVSLYLLSKNNIKLFNKEKNDFSWIKNFFKVGGVSGIESLVRNLFYMLMICRMVNMVGEQGTYWVANNFIWGWLLLPILQLGELIKQEVSKDSDNVNKNTIGYLALTIIICLLWFALIPLYKPFMTHVLHFNDVDKLFNLIMVLIGFYVLFAIQNVFDSIFYGLGKTNYMLFESVVTNTIYYGICFILYITNLWEPTLLGIALMFGIGNAFDSVVSYIAFRHLSKKKSFDVLNPVL